MSEQEPGDANATKTEGAIKAGSGEYFFDLNDLSGIEAGPEYTSANGAVVEGERVLVGLMSMAAGTEAGMHTHANEQFLWVRQGTFWFEIDGEEATLTEGSLTYIPADAPHRSRVVGDEDVVFFTAKDLRSGISGTPVDESASEPADRDATTPSEEDKPEPLNEGAIRAGYGDYYFDLKELAGIDAGPDYSTAHGTVVEGDRIQVGLMYEPAGTGAHLHTHPNEQFTFWIQGESVNVVDDQERITSAGMLRYVPSETEHKSHATGEEDVYFFTVKDLSHGIAGTPVDDAVEGAYRESDEE